MKYFEKIVKYFTDVLLIAVIAAIILALYSLLQLVIFDKDYVNYFGYTIFEVESGSMSPTINVDDMIVVKLSKDIKKGNIITYMHEDDFITHRVIEVLDDRLVTKGDYNNSEDKIIDKDVVLGKVVKVFPKFGVWREILLSPKIIILIFTTLILFSFGCAYTGKKKSLKLEEEKNEEEIKKQSEIRKSLEEENKKLKEELEKENEKKRLREQFENEKKQLKEELEAQKRKLKDEHEVEKKKLKTELEVEKRKLKEEKEKNKIKNSNEEIELLDFKVEDEFL